ncbi:unnamed protein product [Rhizopus stolonifer]
MFVLSEIDDTVKIVPSDFRKENVVQDVGLCICVHDILGASEALILYLDGCSYIKVTFRLVVFRPFMGEILIGKIKSCSPDGLVVSLGFFDNILIQGNLLQPNTKFDLHEQIWVWHYEGQQMFMDLDEPIRIRVLSEEFKDTTPTRPSVIKRGAFDIVEDFAANSTRVPPYSITCTIKEDGLGLLSWWSS